MLRVLRRDIFFASGIEAEPLKQILATVAPNILFPYAREAIDNIVVKGGFPALMLAPVNFDALYAQAMAQQAAQGGDQPAEGATH